MSEEQLQAPSLTHREGERRKRSIYKAETKSSPSVSKFFLLSGIDAVPGEAKRDYSEITKQQSTNLVFLHHFTVC